jgi:hypothetical protein
LGDRENDRAARQAQKIPSEKFVKCHPTKGERVPAPEPGEVVIFFEHFRRGFALPARSFLRQFLDRFHLQPHHIGVNAVMALSALASLCEAYLGIWPNLKLFTRLFFLKTQTLYSLLVTYGAASFYTRPTVGFPKLIGKESCKKWQCSVFYTKNLLADANHINLYPSRRAVQESVTTGRSPSRAPA